MLQYHAFLGQVAVPSLTWLHILVSVRGLYFCKSRCISSYLFVVASVGAAWLFIVLGGHTLAFSERRGGAGSTFTSRKASGRYGRVEECVPSRSSSMPTVSRSSSGSECIWI